MSPLVMWDFLVQQNELYLSCAGAVWSFPSHREMNGSSQSVKKGILSIKHSLKGLLRTFDTLFCDIIFSVFHPFMLFPVFKWKCPLSPWVYGSG